MGLVASESGNPYHFIVIESFRPFSSSGHRLDVLLRPLPGQRFPPGMLVEASRKMRDTSIYPVGTRFLAKVCWKQKENASPHLYCNWRDSIQVLDDDQVEKILSVRSASPKKRSKR